MIYIEITKGNFYHEMQKYDASKHFSYEACEALYDYYDERGTDIELDPVAIACDWGEYDAEQLIHDYKYGCDDNCELEDVIEYIEDNSALIKLSGDSYLVLSF